ncbi:unnamed protein product, partial [Scytosiphon promiscuus]
MTYLATPQSAASSHAPARDWVKVLAGYREPSMVRSLFELAVTMVPILILGGAAVWSTSISYWLTVLFSAAASGFLVRLFMIQHDCSHGAFF